MTFTVVPNTVLLLPTLPAEVKVTLDWSGTPMVADVVSVLPAPVALMAIVPPALRLPVTLRLPAAVRLKVPPPLEAARATLPV